jgi:hypothetical protein
MQGIEIDFTCKYAYHTSTTITRENRLTKSTAKKFPLMSGSLFVQASVSYSKVQNRTGA